MRDSEKVVLVTGATSGIGFETGLRLAAAGWTVALHGRSQRTAVEACTQVKRSVPGGSVHAIHADLASLAAVRTLARHVAARWPRLNGLVNNAGVFTPNRLKDQRRLSSDGYELTWAVNYLAPFVLTTALAEALTAAGDASVVNLSSGMHLKATLHWHDLQHAGTWDRVSAYGQSKLALTMFSTEAAPRLGGRGIRLYAVSPGYVDTTLVREAFGGPAAPPSDAAKWVTQPLLEPMPESAAGQYLDQGQPKVAHPLTADADARARLWDETCRQVRP